MYRCWGEEDNDLYDALQFLGLQSRELPESLLRHIAHGDEDRTRDYPITDVVLGHAINRVYRLIKWDMARLNRELLDLDTRAPPTPRSPRLSANRSGPAAPAI